MTGQAAWEAVCTAIGRIAPEVDVDALDEGVRLRQDLELDSLDFLRVLENVVTLTGVDVPERAYGEVTTVGGLVGYVVAHG
ncbi:acyl carrier protein [Geodermatophilus ruber]|uniref:Acyl carrier protein n=1 Tax=Geodermatophilus ruber TaxID=504800 RepID=A0A1I4BWR8_9ACTN|nr:acyl carrier protein [Geodermatophilus ruber]SFK73085.1 Acyl carrier protein [Geodermatophilus ruber]